MKIRSLAGLASALGLLAISIAFAKENTPPAIVGDWHGSSICLVRPSACHDEEALYHVRAVAGDPAKFSMQADKIVEGRPEEMGTADCDYNTANRFLHCAFKRGYVDLSLEGDSLDGAMFLTDKTRWREIKLTRVKQQTTP